MAELFMFYDTETTDKWLFKDPKNPKGPTPAYNDPRQPNLIQLGYKVVEPSTRSVIFEVGHLIDSTGFDTWNGIAPDAFAVHGIREQLLKTYGSIPEAAMKNFLRWGSSCRVFVAHNDDFDAKIMQCFAFRAGYNPGNVFEDKKKFCTMKSSTNICNIPGPYGMKWPKLSEAYPFFHDGKQFENAHNALADVNACADIFWRMVDRGNIDLESILNG